MLSAIRPKKRVVFAYMIIPILIYVFAVFLPLIAAGYYSFFQWKGGPTKEFINIQNYISLLKDKVFWHAFYNNIFLVIVCIIGQIGLAFIFVMMINSKLVKFKGMHRTFGFFPSTIAAVSIGFIWTMVYDYNRGILNWFLGVIGKTDKIKVWLNEPKLVMVLIAIPLIWQFIGYYMVILLSAIASIDKEIFEVSEIDGANAWQRAVYIVIPLIKKTVLVCVTLCVAGNMKAFDHIYVMTKGGPGNASMVMALYGKNVSYDQSNMGYGSAISIGIFVLSLLIIGLVQLIVNVLTKEKDGE